MANGSLKPIEEVRVGDRVLATDPETGETGARSVIALIASEGVKDLVQVTVDTDGEKGNETGAVVATDNHPFWVNELQDWRTAGELRRGQWLRTSTGTYIQVADVARWTVADQRVHNLTVENLHTYHVAAGKADVLVHNTSPCLTAWINKVDFSNSSTLSKKYDAHAKDFGINGNRNKANLKAFKEAMRKHMTSPGTKIYRFNYRGQGQAVGFIDPGSGKMVMLRTNGIFWSAYKLGGNQFKSIVDKGYLW